MVMNVKKMLCSMGKGYPDILMSGLIPETVKVRVNQTDDVLTLNIWNEGIFLAFHNDEYKRLKEVTAQLHTAELTIFPNTLPAPLQPDMTRTWVLNTLGKPEKSHPPQIIPETKKVIGWLDRFILEGYPIPLTMQILYDPQETATAVIWLPTADVHW